MDIAAWLRRLGLEQYEATFSRNAIDGTVLPQLTGEDLTDLGIAQVGHRRKLLDAIAALREGSSSQSILAGPAEKSAIVRSSGAERRYLTVLFCDLVGSTALTARLDPEDMADVIRGFQTAVVALVERFDGHIAKFMGDGVLIYFGYPRAHEDDAERAVRTGLDIVQAVRQLRHERGIKLKVRAGIATGPVVVGELIGLGTAQEQVVVGETPNLAARLQAIAAPNTVVIAKDTRRLVGKFFELIALEPQALKGFAEPVQAWSVVQANRDVSRFEGARTNIKTSLIGRKQDLELLRNRWNIATQGNGQVVLLSGEAGIGKSQIAHALRDQIGSESYFAIRYQCSPYHTNNPFYPVTGQIWHAAAFSSGEAPEVRLNKLEALIAKSDLDPAEITPYLASLLSISTNGRYATLDLPPSEIRERTITALIALLVGLTRSKPVLFLVEDAHWMDPTTLELVGRTVQHLHGLCALLIVTFRPEFVAPWGGTHVTAVALDRFEHRQAAEMIEQVTGGKALPTEVLEQIIAKTDGVPLFIEELTKSVLGSGLLREEDGAYVLAQTLTPLAIPSTLQGSLMARLDRQAEAKEIAQIGAAIGREFSYQLTAAVTPLSPEELEVGLRLLVASELIYLRGTPPEASYVFKHALVQDTAYATLLRSRRQRIHADIARVLVERFGDQVEFAPEVIARHYSEAELPEPAARNWLAAAERALSRSANAEADRYAMAGLALIPRIVEGPERRRIELGLQIARGNVALTVKGYTAPETIEILSAAKQILDAGVGTDLQRFSVLYGLWAARYVAAQVEIAMDLARQYVQVAERQKDSTYRMVGLRLLGAAYVAAGQHREGLTCIQAAEQYRDPARQKPLSYRFGQDIGLAVLCHKVWTLWFLGFPDQALHVTEQILAELPGHEHANTVAFSKFYGATFPAIFANDFEKAARYGGELAAYCIEQKMGPHFVSASRLCCGLARGFLEPSTENIQAIRLEMETLHRFGVYVLDSPFKAALVQVLLAAGDVASADALVQDCFAFAKKSGERYWLAELHRLKGRIELQRHVPNAECARTCFTLAIEIAQQQEARMLELRATIDLANLPQGAGSSGEVRLLLARSLDAIEGSDTSIDVRNARSMLAMTAGQANSRK